MDTRFINSENNKTYELMMIHDVHPPTPTVT